jgi:hypothetical protein
MAPRAERYEGPHFVSIQPVSLILTKQHMVRTLLEKVMLEHTFPFDTGSHQDTTRFPCVQFRLK